MVLSCACFQEMDGCLRSEPDCTPGNSAYDSFTQALNNFCASPTPGAASPTTAHPTPAGAPSVVGAPSASAPTAATKPPSGDGTISGAGTFAPSLAVLLVVGLLSL